MKAKIDKDGGLLVEKAGLYQMQVCPHKLSSNGFCTALCPGFDNPAHDSGTYGGTFEGGWIRFCDTIGKRFYDKIVDERVS